MFMAVSLILTGFKGSSVNKEVALARGLVTQVLHLQPTKTGLAKISTHVAQPNLNPGIDRVGQNTQLAQPQ